MKKQLLKISALAVLLGAGLQSNAQILNADAFGFELTNVDWSTPSNPTTGPGNIVQAWSQTAGFTQSNEEAHSGTYSMKAIFDYTAGNPTPKLQTFRSNTNKEGAFSLTVRDYLVSAWIKVTSGTQPSQLNLAIKGAGVNIDISAVPANEWTKVYTVITTVADAALGDNKNWMTVNYTGAEPETGACTIYLDDIKIVEYNGIQSYTFDEYYGFEGADAVVDGSIEPETNGNSSATGWFLQHNDYFSFSDEQAKTGDYSLKFDSAVGAAEKQIQGGSEDTEGTSLISFAAGDYVIQADIYIPSGKSIPSKLTLNVKDNASSVPATSFKAAVINIDPSLTKDTWHTIVSETVTYGQTTDAGSAFKLKADDANTVAYVDNLKWVDAATLSTTTSKIEGASVNASNGTISVSGATLQAVYSITGQAVGTSGLANGVYIVKISKGAKQDAIKVVL
ncbi:hypothetical protein FHR24_001261 [Wenyingzhuangia heitensis]|uniref:Por secretion system C-terminal sorting domain-containing protein n=1 Tax=Wenyingzhuangia heitensis TaxID=1487859 RepID=A0ABX0UCP4_9FLAO|nr:hypothetical protein [Wenyingzhuangia heitensis]NIJ44822.1 hypothetical protein [Wenyingzhuangia heitensis]